MNYIALFMAAFSVLGAADKLIGNRFGLGAEFERGIRMLGVLTLSMLGMIVVSPTIAWLIEPVTNAMTGALDPSIITAMLFANDMGGAPLSVAVGNNAEIASFNALVVSSMMGCTLSFTIPFVFGSVSKSNQHDVILGLLYGIVTIPIGCFVAGLVSGISLPLLLIDLIPLVILSGIVALGLVKAPNLSVKIFNVLGAIIKLLLTVGLAAGILELLVGIKIIPKSESIAVGFETILNIACIMTGAFPFLYLLSKLLNRPLSALKNKVGINEVSMLCLVSTLATSVTAFESMDRMDKRGIRLNAAFSVSAAFVFADHMAFTLSFGEDYILPVILGKLVAGFFALVLAFFMTREKRKDSVE